MMNASQRCRFDVHNEIFTGEFLNAPFHIAWIALNSVAQSDHLWWLLERLVTRPKPDRDEVARAATEDPLRDPTHKYKRNLFGLSITAIVLWIFPVKRYDRLPPLTVFEDAENARIIVMKILFIGIIIQWALYEYYSRRDIREWKGRLTGSLWGTPDPKSSL